MRMTAQEFGEWKVMFTAEQLHPAVEQFRHAQLLAAVHNGPLERQNKQPWRATEFLVPDPWASKQALPPPQNLQEQVNQINQRL